MDQWQADNPGVGAPIVDPENPEFVVGAHAPPVVGQQADDVEPNGGLVGQEVPAEDTFMRLRQPYFHRMAQGTMTEEEGMMGMGAAIAEADRFHTAMGGVATARRQDRDRRWAALAAVENARRERISREEAFRERHGGAIRRANAEADRRYPPRYWGRDDPGADPRRNAGRGR